MSEDRQVTGTLDIWDALSRVYNMPDVPDEAKSIIGDVMLCLPSEEPEPEQNTTPEQPASDRLGVKTCKTCTDTISRQDAYDTLTDYYHHTTQTQHDALRDALSRVPSAQSKPREVVPHRNYHYLSDYWCKCGWHLGKKGDVKHCPDCGRKVIWDG